MVSVGSNRLQWILSGALSASLALAPALAASAQQTAQQTPTPGQQGNWGQAGPPPDAQNGQIPPPDSAAQDPNQSQDQGPSQYPGQTADQTPGAPAAPGAPGVGYGQPGRPAYQPNQNQGNPYQGQQGYQGQPAYQGQQAPPSGPVTVAAGVLLPVRTSEPLDSKRVKPGDYFQGTVAQNIYVGSVLAIPRGAQVTGRVADVKKPGELKGGASIALQLTSLSLGGNSYALASDVFDTSSPGKGGYTAANTIGGTALGAAIGAIAGGGPGAAIGAAAGAGVGLGASAATPGPRSVVPPESLLTFHLTSPATVQPVSYQEAAQIESSVAPPQGRRYPPQPGYGYGGPAAAYAPPPPGYAPYPYAYGYPYPYVYAYPRPYVYGYPYYYGRWR
jgi:hypothetical protein